MPDGAVMKDSPVRSPFLVERNVGQASRGRNEKTRMASLAMVDERSFGLVLEEGVSTYEEVHEPTTSNGKRSKLVSWLVIASSWVFTLLIIILGFFLVGILELFGLSEDVSWELMGTLVYVAVLAMTVLYLHWDGDLGGTLQMFKIGSLGAGFIFLVGLPFMITVIDLVATSIYDMLYIALWGESSIPEMVYYVDDSEYDIIRALSFVSIVIAAPVVEEILFRGYILDAIREMHGDVLAVLGSSVLFGLLHLEPYVVGMATVGGIVYGILRIRSGSLWPCIVSHMLWNFFAFLYIWYG